MNLSSTQQKNDSTTASFHMLHKLHYLLGFWKITDTWELPRIKSLPIMSHTKSRGIYLMVTYNNIEHELDIGRKLDNLESVWLK